tara:strand:- start:17 stop:748 length:732 start_codon:yes stop_codon:yes gene_type:complete
MKKDSLTVILAIWKRDYLSKQIDCMLAQTIKADHIIVFQNENHINAGPIVDSYKQRGHNVSLIQSRDINFKFHGRYVIPLLLDTEFTAIFDDDTMPGPKWIENCFRVHRKYNCIVGANGRIITGLDSPDIGYSDGHPVKEDTLVDFVGHCCFFKTEWCRNMWRSRPATWENGEDIDLAAANEIYAGIKCYVAKQPIDDIDSWGDTESELGRDAIATWRTTTHTSLRSDVKKYWMDKGWKPLLL